jgi:hypothetical protein
MRRFRAVPLEDLVLTQLVPGLLLAMAWTVMYEIYHEDGSYYTTLMQEILGTEGLFPYFLVTALLMAFPIGMIVDSLRHVVGEVWLGLPRLRRGWRAPASPLQWMEQIPNLPEDFERRYALYRHAWATLFVPAKAAGNLAVVLVLLGIWFVVKMVRMGSFRAFSAAFVIGTPLVGLGIIIVLLVRYKTGIAEFQRRTHESIFPFQPAPPTGAATESQSSPQ